MGHFCRLKLLTLILVLYVELASTDATTSWQCESAYCSSQQIPASQEVKFTDKPGPATLAIGCVGRQVDLICCTANFAHISWQRRVDDATWKDFLSIDRDNRCLSENNQTASILESQRNKHEGVYRCVAYGHDDVVISNEVKLVIQDCDQYDGPPTRTSLTKYVTEIELSPGQSVDVACSGFFGNVEACDGFCAIGWIRHLFNLSHFKPVSSNTSQRVYADEHILGDQLMSRLHIKEVTDADYRGSYECWLEKGGSYANTTLVRFKPESRVVVPSAWRIPTIVCSSVLAFAVVLTAVLWPLRNDIRLAAKQRQRTPPSSEGLSYDFLLLHADSDMTNRFGSVLYEKMTELSNPPYNLFYYSRDGVLPGQDIIRAMSDSLSSSRCVVVVLCPTFVSRYNEQWFHLMNLITSIDVIYILYGGLDVATVTEGSKLGSAITASIRNSRCLTWSWPIEADANLGLKDKRNIAWFWCQLKLAIPNLRRKISAAGVDQSLPPSAAAEAKSRQGSSGSDSATDVYRPLLPATA